MHAKVVLQSNRHRNLTDHPTTQSTGAGPALGMFELFGRTGPPILEGPPFWTLKNSI